MKLCEMSYVNLPKSVHQKCLKGRFMSTPMSSVVMNDTSRYYLQLDGVGLCEFHTQNVDFHFH